MAKYRKFLLALVMAVVIAALTATTSALDDTLITPQEWVTIALAAATAAGVYLIPNEVPQLPE